MLQSMRLISATLVITCSVVHAQVMPVTIFPSTSFKITPHQNSILPMTQVLYAHPQYWTYCTDNESTYTHFDAWVAFDPNNVRGSTHTIHYGHKTATKAEGGKVTCTIYRFQLTLNPLIASATPATWRLNCDSGSQTKTYSANDCTLTSSSKASDTATVTYSPPYSLDIRFKN